MAEPKWRVMLVAERRPGVVTETELACIERDGDVGLADLGLRLDEAKRLTAALQAEMVPVQMAALGERPRACEDLHATCWRGAPGFQYALGLVRNQAAYRYEVRTAP